jgi:hypothetical protein
MRVAVFLAITTLAGAQSCTITAPGQKTIYVPNCHGTGCNAQGPDCAFCVYDMSTCAQAFGYSACQATYDSRAAQGIYGCPAKEQTPVLAAKAKDTAQCSGTAAGQKMIWVDDCQGTGCNANGVDQDCAWCVYDYTACIEAFGMKACMETEEARAAQNAYCQDSNVTSVMV